jgi:diadenosine tetraphosphate (Ap4A) HIT family hydrolase
VSEAASGQGAGQVGAAPACPLCAADGGVLVLRAPLWRVIRAEDENFPAFYRVVWNAHRAEFTDLTPNERSICMHAVAIVETVLRKLLAPTKINLAAFGTMVPHLHWHVIARYEWDSHFPDAIWAPARRRVEPPAEARLAVSLETLDDAMRASLGEVAARS